MAVTVITDSAAALPDELAENLGIVVVPMQLQVGGQPRAEADVALDELVGYLDEGVQTSGPAPGAFAQAIEDSTGADGAVLVTVGRRYSSTYQSAVTAAGARAPGPVEVVDSATAAGAEGLVALAAARAASAGAAADEVAIVARQVAAQVRLAASVEELRYLVRGGRLPASAARAGTHLGVRLLFELRRGGPRPLRPTLSAEAAMVQLVGRLLRSRPGAPGATAHVAALHALRPAEAETLLAMVRKQVEPATAFVGTFGPVMVAHTGPGVLGLSWWWEQPAAGATTPGTP